MYTETKASKISEVVSSKTAIDILKEAFQKNIKELLSEINYELSENSKSE